jgi:predicted metal-dependent hydrolase
VRLELAKNSVNTETRHITVSGITVEVVRKAIKNLYMRVYPPHGRVRVAAPMAVSNEAVKRAVIQKLGWIKRQQAKFDALPRQSRREMLTGDSHYFTWENPRLCRGTNKV